MCDLICGGSKVYLLTKERTSLGRASSNDIQLRHRSVSSKYAEIEINTRKRKAFVIDLKSTNRTRIGQQHPSKAPYGRNKCIKPNKECILESGDYLTFGGTLSLALSLLYLF